MRVLARVAAIAFFFFLILFLVAPAASSQRTESLFGRVTQVNYLRDANPRDPMVEIRLQGGGKTLTLRLAPASFLNQYGFAMREGEEVGVHWRRDGSGEKATLIVMEIVK